MSSSTSSSEAAAGFLRAFAGWAAAVGLAVAALLLLLDPYDTGRLTPFPHAGVPETAPRMANASRIRDPGFDAAVIGNSTMQLLSPERLDALTGLAFVQLTVPGTGPMEQAAMAERLFAQRGGGLRAVALGLDRTWCDASFERRPVNPFPFWLYGPSDLAYLRSLVRLSSLEFLPLRIRMILGDKRAGRRDGYWNFEAASPPHDPAAPDLSAMAAPAVAVEGPAATGALRRILDAAPAGLRLVLVHPPVYIRADAAPDAAHRRTVAACKAALAAAAAGRPGVAILDFWSDDEATRDRARFIDPIHYRRPMAERIEAAIAARLQGGR